MRRNSRRTSHPRRRSRTSSVWLTEDSLVQLLRDVGFEQVQKIAYGQREPIWWGDEEEDARILLLAVKKRSAFRSRLFDHQLCSSAEVAQASSSREPA
jgi:hypothetical protein